ncbi:MAG: hypothetical protein ACRCZI_11665, partial [Cetobacterium sp.]
ILLRPIRDRTTDSLATAIQDIHTTLRKGGCQPQFHRMDNECPQAIKEYFSRHNITYQLAPPGEHRTNAAERAIRTAKNHLKAGWWSMDKRFPMHLWDLTVPQAEITLNLLRGSRINPKLSAYEQIHGRYDFNATPLAPPGVRVLAHARAGERDTWATHAFEAWYVGPATEHYRCFRVWATKSRKTRIVNQVLWFPPKPFPRMTSEELLRATIDDLKTILLHPPTETYVGHMENTQRGELIQLHSLLNQHSTPVAVPSGKPDKAYPTNHRPTPLPTVSAPASILGVPTPETLAMAPRRSPRISEPPERYNPTANAVTATTTVNGDTPAAWTGDPLDVHMVTAEAVRPNGPAEPEHDTGQPTPFLGMAMNPDTLKLSEYRVLAQSSIGEQWKRAFCIEWGRLFQGYQAQDPKYSVTQPTNTCQLVRPGDMPRDKKATYIRIVADYREQKADPYRVRCTVGGNLIDFPGDKSTRSADLIT